MPTTRVIKLTLDSGVVKYQSTDGSWQPVDEDNPNTGVNDGDEIDWEGDSTISKIKIKPKKSKILDRVDDDDSKKPKGKVKTNLSGRITEKYTIYAKPASGNGGYVEADPKMTYPR